MLKIAKAKLVCLFLLMLTFCPYVLGKDSKRFEACWAVSPKEAEEIEITKRALPESFSYAGTWPRMPVDTSTYRPVVDCIKIKFNLTNGDFNYHVVSSSREILEFDARRKIESLKFSNFHLKNGLIIFITLILC